MEKNIPQTECKTLEEVYQRCLQLSVNVGMPDFCDINWLHADSDGQEFFEDVFKILEDERNVVLYFMHHKMHVQHVSEHLFEVTVKDERTRVESQAYKYKYDTLDKVRDLALIWGKGVEGIHDYGKYVTE